MTKRDLVRTAKLEIEEWPELPQGLALAILFAFIHRVTEGERVEDFLDRITNQQPAIEYENPS